MDRPSRELLAEVFPGVEVGGELERHRRLLSIAKAKALLRCEPQFNRRDHL
jgi:hypothetical protein